jgi:hypothetical protein
MTNSTYVRVMEVQAKMLAIHDKRAQLLKDLSADLGSDTGPGLNLDILSKFGWEIVKLNAEFAELSAEHKELMNY